MRVLMCKALRGGGCNQVHTGVVIGGGGGGPATESTRGGGAWPRESCEKRERGCVEASHTAPGKALKRTRHPRVAIAGEPRIGGRGERSWDCFGKTVTE